MFKSSFAREVVEDVRLSQSTTSLHETRLQQDLLGPASVPRNVGYRSQFAANHHGPMDNITITDDYSEVETSDLGTSKVGTPSNWHNQPDYENYTEGFELPPRMFNRNGHGGVNVGKSRVSTSFLDQQARIPFTRLRQVSLDIQYNEIGSKI